MAQLLLDTNVLIALSDPLHPLFRKTEAAMRTGFQACTSSICWHEYVRGPLLEEDRARVLRVIESRVLPLDRLEAEKAADLYNNTGRRKGSTADCLIAAVAIQRSAILLSANRDDFSRFVPHGLRVSD